MNTHVLAKLLLPKPGDPPEPSFTIIDGNTGEMRPCESDKEVLKATNIKQQEYMSPPNVEKQLHFATPIYDEVGLSGYDIDKGLTIDDAAMKRTTPNYNDCKDDVQHQVKEAHEYMKALFENPLGETRDLNYPFYYDCDTGEFSNKDLTTDFYKSISSEPGSSRHEGYHMAVLGRLPEGWQKGILLFLQNVLVTRCPPPAIKAMSRILIPKGKDKPGQTRPISMADDTYSFLTDQISKSFSAGIEATGRMGEEIKAYRKGKSTTDITIDERNMQEDALENLKLLGIIKEDEEKFFDRPDVALQVIVMRLFGFKNQGYGEWKCEDMLDRMVFVITRYGLTICKFLTGVPQGSTLSVHIANLIIWVKHKVMRLDEVKGLKYRKNAYTFRIWDTGRDDQPIRLSISYCDDNDGIHGAEDMDELKREIEKAIRMTGYFSM